MFSIMKESKLNGTTFAASTKRTKKPLKKTLSIKIKCLANMLKETGYPLPMVLHSQPSYTEVIKP